MFGGGGGLFGEGQGINPFEKKKMGRATGFGGLDSFANNNVPDDLKDK